MASIVDPVVAIVEKYARPWHRDAFRKSIEDHENMTQFMSDRHSVQNCRPYGGRELVMKMLYEIKWAVLSPARLAYLLLGGIAATYWRLGLQSAFDPDIDNVEGRRLMHMAEICRRMMGQLKQVEEGLLYEW